MPAPKSYSIEKYQTIKYGTYKSINSQFSQNFLLEMDFFDF